MKKGIVLIIAIAATRVVMAFDGNGSLNSGGQNRSFVFHAPGSAVATGLPLVIMMHGDGGTGSGLKGSAGFDAVSDAQGFVVVYPDAIGGTWNRYVDDVPGDAGLGNPNAADDVLFVSDLIDYFCDTYQIDPKRVYAGGHSAGGFMAYNLAVKLPSRIAAFAPVAGSLWGDATYLNNYFANNYTPVPIYHVHGDNDGTVAYPDPDHTPVAWEEWPLSGFSYPDCGNNTYTSVSDITGSVKQLTFCDGSGPNGKKVYLVRVMGQGHGWPNVSGYNVASSIWSFFYQYQLAAPAGCETVGIEDMSPLKQLVLAPVPAEEYVQLLHLEGGYTATVRDISGKTVTTLQGMSSQQIDVSELAPGAYFMTVAAGGATRTLKFIRR